MIQTEQKAAREFIITQMPKVVEAKIMGNSTFAR
jgi:hypothetical protein